MKKTLLVTLDFYPAIGGISHYWESLGKHMPASRLLVCAPLLPSGTREIETSYKIFRVRMISRFFFPRWAPLILKIISIARREGIETIIAGQVLPVGTAVAVAARLLRIPYYVSVHGMDVALPLRHPRKRALCGRILHNAQMVITNSEYTSQIVQQYGVSKDRIAFVFPCPWIIPAENETTVRASREKKEIILLTVSRIVKRKGHEFVIRALAQLRDFIPPFYYVIVGDGPERSNLELLAQTVGVSDRVLFTGAIQNEAVRQWYRKCDIAILTPYDINGDVEGFGITYLEANAFGKPVIASRTGGVESAVIHEKTGLLVEPQNTEAIVQAVRRLCDDPRLAFSLGSFGKKRVEQQFQWSVQAEHLIRLLDPIP
ncbi:glycosyltransferase family 4 protein [Candidatus Uhrbacteria bacterium]|nr:glycosyltransferase family 4 protein [Candidatus Uhrbacteria bacterium]